MLKFILFVLAGAVIYVLFSYVLVGQVWLLLRSVSVLNMDLICRI